MKCHHGYDKFTCGECQWEKAYWCGWEDAMDQVRKDEQRKEKPRKKRAKRKTR